MNTYFVVVFNLADGCVDELVGPFDDAGAAMTWADSDSLLRTAESPKFTKQSTDDLILVADFDAEDPAGWSYQIVEPMLPAVVVGEHEEE